MSTQITVLSGHTSPETAYVVEDYPYGFRLRCKMRYWLEFNPKRGHRLWSQSSNPKKPGLVWNKPKASTFQRFAGAMFLSNEGHVHWSGLNEYDDVKICIEWRERFGAAMPEAAQQLLKAWITRKLAYEQSKAEGLIVSRTTTTQYGSVLGENFRTATPIAPPEVKTEVLKSQHSPAELAEMGASLRTPTAEGIKQL